MVNKHRSAFSHLVLTRRGTKLCKTTCNAKTIDMTNSIYKVRDRQRERERERGGGGRVEIICLLESR